MVETINRLMKESRHLVQELDREPTMMELALECRIPSILTDQQRLAFQLYPAPLDPDCIGVYDPLMVRAVEKAVERTRALLDTGDVNNPSYMRLKEVQVLMQRALRRPPSLQDIAIECRLPEICPSRSVSGCRRIRACSIPMSRYYDPSMRQVLERAANKVRDIQKAAQEPVSLATPVGQEEDSSLGDFIEDSQGRGAVRRRDQPDA